MKATKKMKSQPDQVLFLEKLTDLVQRRGFRGPIPGEPMLPTVGDSLTLKQITKLKVMMGFPDIARSVLDIGGEVSDELIDLNDALKPAHGAKEHKEMKTLLSQHKKADDLISNYKPESTAKKPKPRST
jgi:hypothetical protein